MEQTVGSVMALHRQKPGVCDLSLTVLEPLSKNMTGAPPLKMAPNSLWVTAVFLQRTNKW